MGEIIYKKLSSLIIQLILTEFFITCIPLLSLSPSPSTNDDITTPLSQTLHHFYHYNHNCPQLLHHRHLSTAPPIQQPPFYPPPTTINTHLFTTTNYMSTYYCHTKHHSPLINIIPPLPSPLQQTPTLHHRHITTTNHDRHLFTFHSQQAVKHVASSLARLAVIVSHRHFMSQPSFHHHHPDVTTDTSPPPHAAITTVLPHVITLPLLHQPTSPLQHPSTIYHHTTPSHDDLHLSITYDHHLSATITLLQPPSIRYHDHRHSFTFTTTNTLRALIKLK